MAHKTHKDRVNEFNSHLESLSEHHDIPKVRPKVESQIPLHTHAIGILFRWDQDNIRPTRSNLLVFLHLVRSTCGTPWYWRRIPGHSVLCTRLSFSV